MLKITDCMYVCLFVCVCIYVRVSLNSHIYAHNWVEYSVRMESLNGVQTDTAHYVLSKLLHIYIYIYIYIYYVSYICCM
jgi:hypothetical protein